jgi:hypothetical protein
MKWHHYYEIYETYFPASPKIIVEIGVAKGDGLKWLRRKYPGAKLIGIEKYMSGCKTDKGDWELIEADQRRLHPTLISHLGTPDVIIDDARHWPNYQAASFKKLFPILADGGVYAIEDLEVGQHFAFRLYSRFFGIQPILRKMIAGMSKWEGWGREGERAPLSIMFFPQLVLIKKGTQRIYTSDF